jgi:hypothetical protein
VSDKKLAVIKAKMVIHEDNNGTFTLVNLSGDEARIHLSSLGQVTLVLRATQANAFQCHEGPGQRAAWGYHFSRIDIGQVLRDEAETLWMVAVYIFKTTNYWDREEVLMCGESRS